MNHINLFRVTYSLCNVLGEEYSLLLLDLGSYHAKFFEKQKTTKKEMSRSSSKNLPVFLVYVPLRSLQVVQLSSWSLSLFEPLPPIAGDRGR